MINILAFYGSNDPYRVEFSGYLPELISSKMDNQFLTIDFYLVESVTDLSYEVAVSFLDVNCFVASKQLIVFTFYQPTPGIGCNEYLEVAKSFPTDDNIGLTDNFYFSAIESTEENDEIYIKVNKINSTINFFFLQLIDIFLFLLFLKDVC